GEIHPPHGKKVFWKPPMKNGGGNTFTVTEAMYAIEDKDTVPQCITRSQAKCIGTSCNVTTCPRRNYARQFKVNKDGLVVCKAIRTTYTEEEFAKVPFGPAVMAAMIAAIEEEAITKAA